MRDDYVLSRYQRQGAYPSKVLKSIELVRCQVVRELNKPSSILKYMSHSIINLLYNVDITEGSMSQIPLLDGTTLNTRPRTWNI